jgi:hypothetical protein
VNNFVAHPQRPPTVTGKWRIPFDEDLYHLYCSLKISLVIKSIRMRCAGHVARMGDRRGAYWVLLGMPEERVHSEDLVLGGKIKVDL